MRQQLEPLRAELARWRDAGLVLPIWWRDDDATQPTPALDRLLLLGEEFRAPLHLAVIPEPAGPDLAERLRHMPDIFVLPHGWRHENHAPANEKKAEFGAHRPLPAMLDEITQGWERLRGLFPAQALPVFTPPWNRVAPSVVGALSGIGLAALSTYTPRRRKFAAPGLVQVNTHVDPVDWRARRLLDPSQAATQAAVLLAERRLGRADNSEPFGLMTHHLVHDDAIWTFAAEFLDILAKSGVVRWTSPLHEIGD